MKTTIYGMNLLLSPFRCGFIISIFALVIPAHNFRPKVKILYVCTGTAEPGGLGGGGFSPPTFAKTTFRFQKFLR